MLIKIKGRNEERLKNTIARVMNIACVSFGLGRIPSPLDIVQADITGKYWVENQKEGKFEILPIANNYKAFATERGDNFVVVQFYSRYDRGEIKAFCDLILSLFGEDEIEPQNALV